MQMQKKAGFWFLLFTFLITATVSRGQGSRISPGIDRPVRVEIPARSIDETYHIIPVDSSRVMLYFRSIETMQDTLTKWYFSLYDENLHPVWVKSFPVRTGMEIRDYCLFDDVLSFVFLPGEKAKDIGYEMIAGLDCKSGTFTGTRQMLKGNISPVKFLVIRDRAAFGYNLKNEPAHIQFVEPGSGRVTDHPLTALGTTSTLTGFIVDTTNRVLYAIIRKPALKNRIVSVLLKMNFSGEIISETEINSISPSWEIRNIQLILVNTDDLLALATYSVSGRSGKNGSLSGSSGFFTCRIRNGIQTDIRFKNFLDLKNFQNIIGDKDMAAIKRRAEKQNRSVSDYAQEVSLLVHPLVVHGDQVIFTGESYVPEYHPENFTEFDFYGRPYINTYNVFDGYRFTSAIIAGFDKTGNLMWDNSMEIRNLISAELKPKVNVYCSASDTMVLCYSSEARIASKIIRENEVVEKLDFSAMEQLYPEDKMLTESKNYMVSWHGPYFLCYGYQEIKNINSSENKKRLVYYFTKVRFD
jgi:hypothetical protein